MKPMAPYQEQVLHKFLGMLPANATSVLEIGSDVDYLVVDNLAQRFSGKIVGINPTPGFVKRAPTDGPANVTLLEADGCQQPFEDSSIDAILSIATLEHVLDLPAFLSECRRVLKPGGIFYTNFGPIWSCCVGHHVCAFAGRKEARFWKPERNPLPDFSHLLWNEEEMRNYLLDSPYDDRLIDPIIHWVYHADSINRLFFEDYVAAFKNCRMDIAAFAPAEQNVPGPDVKAMLANKYGHTRTFNYSTIDLTLIRPQERDLPATTHEASTIIGARSARVANDLFEQANLKLAPYKDKHKGQRCVIIGNGPSLAKMDLSFLENEITFGMNRIFLLFDTWAFRPTYYASVNPLVIEQSADDILKINAPKFLSEKGMPFIKSVPEDLMFIRSNPEWKFFTDPYNGLCEGWTVTFFAMQLAYFMGFSEVVLIGVDHHFVTQGDPNKEVVSEGADPNHFHPDYFGKGVRWHLPDLERSEGSYRMAKQCFDAQGRRIIDATVGGKLTIFPKVDYQEYFSIRHSPQIVQTKITQAELLSLMEQFIHQPNETIGGKLIRALQSWNLADEAEKVRRALIAQQHRDRH